MDKNLYILALGTLETHKKLVWSEIKKYLKSPNFPSEFKIPQKYKDLENFHWKVTNEYSERKGKYLRPTLLMLSNSCMGGSNEEALKTAAAMQLSEDWILIHDDIEDDSLERRGKPTLHRMYNPPLAINSGDSIHAIMWKVLFDNLSKLGLDKSQKIVEEFYSIMMRTTLGQTVDIKWFTENKLNLTDEDWYFVADSKSSYYTIAGPIRLGAIIADATPTQLQLLTKFGLQLGRVFQLVDDILDVTSDFKGLKKQVGNDIFEGKRTILLGHLLRVAGGKDKEKLTFILKKSRNEKTEEEILWVINKMHEYKSVDYARKLARKHKEKAESIFDNDLKFLSKKPERQEFKNLITFILERDH